MLSAEAKCGGRVGGREKEKETRDEKEEEREMMVADGQAPNHSLSLFSDATGVQTIGNIPFKSA